MESRETEDKYSADIDFSNACREFYITRVKATEVLKNQIQKTERTTQKQQQTFSLQSSMDKLRREMASLMDQDLSLMKQLLTLNEAIEDIKTQRLYGTSKESLRESSDQLNDSYWSDAELYESEDDRYPKTSTVTNLLVPRDPQLPSPKIGRIHSFRRKDKQSNKSCELKEIRLSVPKINFTIKDSDAESSSCVKKIQVKHGAQSSIDSGYDESDSYQTDIEVTI